MKITEDMLGELPEMVIKIGAGRHITELRQGSRLTIDALAELTGVSARKLQRLEIGKLATLDETLRIVSQVIIVLLNQPRGKDTLVGLLQ